MKVKFLLVGKTNNANLDNLIADYHQRLTHYVPFEVQIIPELKNTKKLSETQQKTAEGELILKSLDSSSYLILLDEHGKEFRSVEFAAYLKQKLGGGNTINDYANSGSKTIVFVVGGPYGFSQAVYDRANDKISLSKMTFSHQMIRLIFIEQLYRAMTILRGEPYHHE